MSSRPDIQALWQQAGGSVSLEPASPWFAAQPRSEWDLDPDELGYLEQRWDPLVGDRMTELVFIGIDMDEAAIRAALDACALTAEEIEGGFDAWIHHNDPMPPWDMGDDTSV